MLSGVVSVGRATSNHEFVRFVIASRTHEESQTAIGLVALAYELSESSTASSEVVQELQRWLSWFEENLDIPDRFNRTKSKGWYRRATRGISWLRSTATEHISAMQALATVVSKCGYGVTEVREDRVGYVIYEDEAQVVAEPFRDTRTQ